MGDETKILPNQEDLEKAIKMYDQFASQVKTDTQDSTRRVINAATIDMLPDSIKPYAKAELAAQYLIEAQKTEKNGNHAAAKIYTAIAMNYMSQTGINLNQVLPGLDDKDDVKKYIASLFEPASKYKPTK